MKRTIILLCAISSVLAQGVEVERVWDMRNTIVRYEALAFVPNKQNMLAMLSFNSDSGRYSIDILDGTSRQLVARTDCGESLTLAIDPTGTKIVGRDADESLAIWRLVHERDAVNNLPMRLIKNTYPAFGAVGAVQQIAWSPDGNFFAYSALSDTSIVNATTGDRTALANELNTPIAFSPNGTWLAINDREGLQTFKKEGNGYRRNQLYRQTRLNHIEFSPNGRFMLTVEWTTRTSSRYLVWPLPLNDKEALIAQGTRPLLTVSSESSGALGAIFCGSGLLALNAGHPAGSTRDRVEFWDIESRKKVGEFQAEGGIGSLAFDVTTSTLAVLTDVGIELWRIKS